jgi:hypothetical protein
VPPGAPAFEVLAADREDGILTEAPGNWAPIGEVKVANGWFADAVVGATAQGGT